MGLALMAVTATAQSVVIVDKDGVTHKFATEYVENITFTPVTVTPAIEFTSLDLTPYSNGNVGLKFIGEGIEIGLDTYCGTEAVYLLPGTYNAAQTQNAMEINCTSTTFTYVNLGGENIAITGGSMEVTRNARIYTINLDFTIADGSKVRGTWSGELSKFSPYKTVEFTNLEQIEVRDPLPGEFYLRGDDGNYGFECVLDFIAAAGSATLPDGTYTLGDGQTPGTYTSKSIINLYSPNFDVNITAPVTVKTVDGLTSIESVIMCDNGLEVTLKGNVAIKYLNKPVEDLDLTLYDVHPYSGGNVGIKFKNGDNIISLDTYCGTEATYLVPGTYTLASNGEMEIDKNPQYSYYQTGVGADQKRLGFNSGTMEVSVDVETETYTIALDLVVEDGTQLKGKWSGTLTNYTPFIHVELTELNQVDIDDALPGEFYMRGHAAAYKYECVLDFITPAGSKTIPDGTYTLGDGETPGTYTAKSQIDAYNPSAIYKFTGPIEVKTEGNVTNITSVIDLGDGRTVTFKSNVPVTYLTPVEPEIPVFTSLTLNPYSNGNVGITLSKENLTLNLDTYCGVTATYLIPGTYTVTDSGSEMYIDSYEAYTYAYVNGDTSTKVAISSGSMEVAVDTETKVYTITVDMTLADGTAAKGKWSGVLDNYSPFKTAELVALNQLDIDMPQPGEFYMKGNGANWSFECVLDFITPAGSKTIPDGTYTLGDGETPGTYTSKSIINFYNPAINVRVTAPITVKTENGVTSIEALIESEDGMQVTLTGNVEIEYLEPVEPEIPTFTNFALNPYSNGNVGITLSNDNLELNLDTYCGVTATYLLPGTYTVTDSGSEMYIDSYEAYTYAYVNGDKNKKVAITSGTMEVSVDVETKVYTITVDMTLADGTAAKGKWSGVLDKYSPFKTAELVALNQLDIDMPKPGEFYMKGNGANWSFECVLDFITAPGSKRIPDGTYTLGDGETPGTYTSKSIINFYNPAINVRVTAPITVKTENGVTSIEALIESEDGMQVTLTGNVEIQYLEPDVPEVPAFSNLKLSPYSGGNVEINLSNENLTLNLDTYCGSEARYLMPGTYTVGGSVEMYIGTNEKYTYAYVNGSNVKTAISSGTMEVEVDVETKIYTITTDITLADGTVAKGSWSGVLPAYSPFKTAKLVALNQIDIDNPKPGEFYLRGNGEAHNFECVLDFIAPAGSETLPDGTYTLGDGETPGTYTSKSIINFYNPNMDVPFTAPITVKSENGKRIFESLIECEDGMQVTFTGNLEINYVQY